jgi:NADPH2:quinone reductase
VFVIAGSYVVAGSPAASRPFVAGGELAGEVVAVGDGVAGWAPGDRVMGMGRGYAELAVVEASLAWRVPDGATWAEGGALPVGIATMHDALVTNGRFEAGDHVVVNAASSGVGVIAVRLALAAGAGSVIGTSRSVEKRDRLVALVDDGRFVAVAPDDLVDACRERSGGAGAAVIVDNVGATALAANVDAAALGGRIVQVGRLGGRHDTIDLDELARKRISLVGVTFRTRTPAQRATVVQTAWQATADAIADGSLRPVIAAEHALADIHGAFEALTADRHVGKLVIVP